MALQVFNWEGISSNADALAALRVVLSQSLPCLVRRTVRNSTTDLGIVTTVLLQVQPAHHVNFCQEENGGAALSFMTCDATRNASVEVQVGGQRIGDILHVTFPTNSGKSANDLIRDVSMPMFKDATAAAAAAAAADIIVIITTRGCNGSQSMRTSVDVTRDVLKC
jgi:hypothetical protein